MYPNGGNTESMAVVVVPKIQAIRALNGYHHCGNHCFRVPDDNGPLVAEIPLIDLSILAVLPNVLLNSVHFDFCNHVPNVLYLSLNVDDPNCQLLVGVAFHVTFHC